MAAGEKRWSTSLPVSSYLFTSVTSPNTLPTATSGGSGSSGSTDPKKEPRIIPGVDGGLYAFIPSDDDTETPEYIQRLPVSVPEMVTRAPFTGPDGILYMGDRQSVVFSVDSIKGKVNEMYTQQGGMNKKMFSDGDKLPGEFKLGRIDYFLKAIDPKTSKELWNVTLSE